MYDRLKMKVIIAAFLMIAFLMISIPLVEHKSQDPRNDDVYTPSVVARITDIPSPFRESNYSGGSCAYASLATVLRSQGFYSFAAHIRSSYTGAANRYDVISAADNLTYAYTDRGDPAFIDWCDRTQRSCIVFYPEGHAITFIGYTISHTRDPTDQQTILATFIDNNYPSSYKYVEKSAFLQKWRALGGFAFTTVYPSVPPAPNGKVKP